MIRIGVILTAYACEETLEECLKPWVSYRERNPHSVYIAANSFLFKDAQKKDNGKTESVLKDFFLRGHLSYKTGDSILTEAEARNISFEILRNRDVDYYWILDGDEIYTEEQIGSIIEYIKKQTFITWYRLSFKNYVFDEKTFLRDPFTPPRIFKSRKETYEFSGFYFDNDPIYKDIITEKEVSYKNFSSKTVPPSIAHIKHLTWLSNKNSKDKVEYQNKHFGNSGCSYRWNYDEDKLEFNKDFFIKNNQSIPEVENE